MQMIGNNPFGVLVVNSREPPGAEWPVVWERVGNGLADR